MNIISFAWTTPALLAGRKTVTRRQWKASHRRRFHVGELVAAYDRSPRVGGKQVATIRLLSLDYQRLQDMPLSDYENEGFGYMAQHGIPLGSLGVPDWDYFERWRYSGGSAWVIRFEVVG